MTATAPSDARSQPPDGHEGQDGHDTAGLADFGYRQELHRSLGRYASFAAGFSFISVLTTVFQFFAFGYSFGGPRFFWTWPAVLIGQLLVAACFAELAARYPISGAVYQWSSRLSNAVFGWYAGWIMVLGQIAVVAAAALALQVVLPAVWSGFQLVGTDTSPVSSDGAANAAVLGVVLLVLTTLVNLMDNKVMSLVNRIGVTAEIVGAILIIVLLFTHADRSPSITVHSGGGGSALLVGSFAAAYVMIGFDSAGEMSEETRHPRRVAPRTILTALAAAGVLASLLVLAALLAAPSLTDGRLGTDGLSYVLTSRLGSGLGRVLLCDVALAVAVATLAIQTSATRMLFSMARDRALPFSSTLARVSPRTGQPAAPALVVGVLSASIVLIAFASPEAWLAIGTTCIVMLYLAYSMVTGPQLLRRLRGPLPPATDESGNPVFSLGRWGVPVNAAALLYGLVMTVNLAWPRAAVYDPSGDHWYFQWFSPLFLLVTLVLGFLWRATRAQRARAERDVTPQAVLPEPTS
jgi:urea carboxylase system permease